MRYVRRIMPILIGHGSHAPDVICHDPGRHARGSVASNTPWICVSCYHCVVRCPQGVHIADVMYTLKSMAIKAKLYRTQRLPIFHRHLSTWWKPLGAVMNWAGRSPLSRGIPIAPAGHGADGFWHGYQRTHGNHTEKDQAHGSTEAILDRAKQLELTS